MPSHPHTGVVRFRPRILLVAVAVTLLSILTAVVWHSLDGHLTLPFQRSVCVVTKNQKDIKDNAQNGNARSTVTLKPERMANASTIAAVGLGKQVPYRGIVVALATAMQESKLDNVKNGDRDSVGLFQQRPSQGWGTVEQISNPRFAADAFYTHLVKVPGWEEMRITDAAQAVQRSAYPEAYEKWGDEADVLGSALTGESSQAVSCTLSTDFDKKITNASTRLADQFTLEWGETAENTVNDSGGIAFPVQDAKTGWQYAHWLVAQAKNHAITHVTFSNRTWTPDDGSWQAADEGKSDTTRVTVGIG